jgi:hypothetical protein
VEGNLIASDRDLADRIILFYGNRPEGAGRGIEINHLDQLQAIGVEDYADLNATLMDLLDAELLAFAQGVNNGRKDLEIGNRRAMRLTIAGRQRYQQLEANRAGKEKAVSSADERAASLCAGILLEDEPKELLSVLVEASRRVPRDQRQKFMVAKHSPLSILLHPGLPRQENIYYGDIEALASAGLLALSFGGNATPIFDVTSLGFRYYAYLKEREGSPIRTVEAEIRQYVNSTQMASLHAISFNKWRQAEELLWGADADIQFTTIGHLCREAIQEFADELVRSSGVVIDQVSKEKTVAKIKAVLSVRHATLGDSHAAFLDALLTYWGTVSDLIQRQEHGSSKVGAPLEWEDARRVVFQTLLVMYELSRSLSNRRTH